MYTWWIRQRPCPAMLLQQLIILLKKSTLSCCGTLVGTCVPQSLLGDSPVVTPDRSYEGSQSLQSQCTKVDLQALGLGSGDTAAVHGIL